MKKEHKKQFLLYSEAVLLTAVYCLSFVFSDNIKKGVGNSLSLCLNVIIPSVFPVMTVSNTLLLLGVPDALNSILELFSEKLFGLSGGSAACILFSLTGGYPVGVKNAKLLYEKKRLTLKEAQRTALMGVSPGLSFTISVVGAFFNSKLIGVTVCISSILASISLGIILNAVLKPIKPSKKTREHNISVSEAFCSALEKSTFSVISICSYIIIFSALSALLSSVLPPFFGKLLTYLSEVTSGTALAAKNGNIIFAGFLCGFGGLCIFGQLLPDIKFLKIKAFVFLLCRIITGLFSAFYTSVFSTLLRLSVRASNMPYGSLYSNSFSGSLMLLGAVILMIVSSLEKTSEYRL